MFLASYSISWLKNSNLQNKPRNNCLKKRQPVINIHDHWLNIYTCKPSLVEYSRVNLWFLSRLHSKPQHQSAFRERWHTLSQVTVASEQYIIRCWVFWKTWELFLIHRKPEGHVGWSCVDSHFMQKPCSISAIHYFRCSFWSSSRRMLNIGVWLYDVFSLFECIQGFIFKRNVNLHRT